MSEEISGGVGSLEVAEVWRCEGFGNESTGYQDWISHTSIPSHLQTSTPPQVMIGTLPFLAGVGVVLSKVGLGMKCVGAMWPSTFR